MFTCQEKLYTYIDENASPAKSSGNAPQSRESANADTADVPGETPIDENPAQTTPDGFSPGVDYNDPVTAQYARTLTKETRVRADTVLRLLGKRLRFADSVEGGAANGRISANEIVLSGAETLDAADPDALVRRILGHELTHGLQQDAPDAYARFRDAALDASIGKIGVREHADDIRKLYEARGRSVTEEAALDEAVADYGGELMSDPDTAQRFIERNRADKPLLTRIRDALAALVRKLTGADKNRVMTVRELFDAALDAAAKAVRDGQTAAQPDSGATRYSLNGDSFTEDKYFARQIDHWDELPDGTRIKVGVVRGGSALNRVGLPASRLFFDVGKIKTAMEKHSDHLTPELLKGIPDLLNDPVVIAEYAGAKNTVNVYGNLFLEKGRPVVVGVVMRRDINGQNIINNIRTIHARRDFANQITDTSVLYLNEDRKKVRSWFHVCGNLNVPLDGTKYGLIRSISFENEKSKGETKLSLSGTEDAERLNALIARNRELEADLQRYQKNLAEAKTLSGARQNYAAAQVRAVTETFLKDWQSPLDAKRLSPDVAKLRAALRAGPNGDGSAKAASDAAYQQWAGEIEDMARHIAKRVIESAVGEVENPELETLKQIGAELKTAKLAYDDLKKDMPAADFEAWRRRNQFRLGLRKNGASVDSYWADWNQRYGEVFFPSDITAPSDMLFHLSELMDRNVIEYANPYDRYNTLEVVEDCKNALLDAIMNADESGEVPADAAQSIRDNAFRKGVEKSRETERKRYAKSLKTLRDMAAEERAEGERRLESYKGWVDQRREQRIETAQKNAVRRQLDRIAGQLNRKNMPGGERAFLNSIFREIDAIAKERTGVSADELWRRLDYYWQLIDENSALYKERQEKGEDFIENPFRTLDAEISLAQAANERKLSGEEMNAVRKEFSNLNAAELRRVLDFLKAFNHAQQTRDEMIAARDKRDLNQQADNVIESVRAAKGFAVPLVTYMTRPLSFAKRITGYIENSALVSAIKDFQAGERARDDYQRRGYDTLFTKFAEGLGYANISKMSAEQRRKAVKAVQDGFRVLSGPDAAKQENLIKIQGVDPTTREKVTAYITKGMRASLYMHSRNEDNMRHIRYGGFVVPGVEQRVVEKDGKKSKPKSGWDFYRKGNYGEAYTKYRQHIRLTAAQVQDIVKDITKEEKALADAAAWYYDRMSKRELSAVHEKLKGWSPFYVENYMPIETDAMFRFNDYEQMRPDGSIGSIGRPGFAYERVHSGNTIILRDLNLTLVSDISRHSRFIGLAIPVRNMNKLLNRNQVILADEEDALRMVFSGPEAQDIQERADAIRQREPNAKADPLLRAIKELEGAEGLYKFQDARRANAFHKSVMDNIGSQFGEAATKYIKNLMSDISGVGKERGSLERMFSTLTGNYAGAVLTFNASTAMVQTASYPTAAAVLGYKPLVRAAKDLPDVVAGRANLDLINAYTSRLWERSQGYTTWEKETMSAEKHLLPRAFRKGVNIIQGMDVGTTTLLWKACEYYVDEENERRRKEGTAVLERGTPEQVTQGQSAYYRAVADVYNRVIEGTQPSYGVMERPQILRSDNELVRMTNMFKTQMYQNFNILYDAFGELGARQRERAASPNAETDAAVQEALRGVGAALSSQVAAALIAAVVKGAFAVFTGGDDKYKDKEGNLTAGSWLGGVLRGTVATFPGFVAYGSEAYSALANLIDNAVLKSLGKDPFFLETFYGVNFSAFGEMKNAVTRTGSALGGLLSALAAVAQGLDDERTDWRALGQKLLSAASDWAMFAGIPARNVTKLLYGVVRLAAKSSMGDTAGEFATRKLLSTTLDSEIYKLLYQSLADGDLETFKNMAEDVQRNFRTASGGRVTGKTVRDKMLSMWREEEKTKGASRLGQAARDYIGAVEQYATETPEKFTEGDLSPEQYRAYRDEYEREFRKLSDALNRSPALRGMDEKTRLGVVANAAKLVTALSLERHSGGKYQVDTSWIRWASGGQPYGVSAVSAILFKAAYDSVEPETDLNGNPVAASKKRATLELAAAWLPDLTARQLDYLQSFYWTPRNGELRDLKENGYRESVGEQRKDAGIA